jgi:hypothetical protein
MYQCILIATDGSPLSRKAVSSGIALAELTGAKIVALKVVPRYPLSYFEGGMAVSVQDVAKVEQQWAEGAQTIVVRPDRRGDCFCGQKTQMRPDRDGLAWTARHQAPAAGQRNHPCADAFPCSGAGIAVIIDVIGL